MTFLTFIIIAPIAFGIAYGFYRGFFKELVGIIYIVVALFAARYLGAFVADILSAIFGWSLLVTKPISFILIFARGVGGWVLFGLVWTTAVVGIVLYAVWGSELKIVNLVFYFVIGWAGLFLMRRFYLEHALRSFAYLVVSGLLYSSGCAFFLLRKIKYMHAAGNVLMLLGTLNLYASLFFSVA